LLGAACVAAPVAVDAVAADAVFADSVAVATTPCAAVTVLLDAQFGVFTAYLDNDPVRLAAGIEELPTLVAALRADPPGEIGDEVEIWMTNADETLRVLDGVTDPDIMLATLSTMPPPPAEFTVAQQDVEAWAGEHCGWRPPASGPPDCHVLDPMVVVGAAALDIDVTVADAVFDGGGPVFATQACGYAGGALYLTTIAFDDVGAASTLMVSMATATGGGEVLDVDVGTLPDSTVVIGFDDAVQVVVFESDVPFAITIAGSDVDPLTSIVAAEALVASLLDDAPGTSVSPSR
jgi:hypothetical protein